MFDAVVDAVVPSIIVPEADFIPDFLPDESETRTVLLVAIIFIMVDYTALLGYLLHNMIMYVVGQSRFKIFHISLFYVLAFVIIVLRLGVFITLFVYLLDLHVDEFSHTIEEPPAFAGKLDSIAVYFELILGMQ